MSIDQTAVASVPGDDEQPLLILRLCGDAPSVLIQAIGEIDLTNAHLFTELVDHVATRRPARVVLDLAGITFFCADGLRALLQARDTVQDGGGQLLLPAPSSCVRRILTLTRTGHLFAVEGAGPLPCPDRSDAVTRPQRGNDLLTCPPDRATVRLRRARQRR